MRVPLYYNIIELCMGEIEGKICFKCHKAQANSILLTTKSALWSIKYLLPMCYSAGY